ncbi:DUF2785 domain-containing protein [Lapidilactobacillus luobeiensis]|uniref:DUF2785 domain-containing protein n=1 Tax=Lapidilactobacillus luobeiensis TaxID=2950371 RepID=UPI0021C39C67|nr:DUF2785 domain-containing protein [Lapidilactobacillus luobeiensis]
MAISEVARVKLALNDIFQQFNQGLNFEQLGDQLLDLKGSVQYRQRRSPLRLQTDADPAEIKKTIKAVTSRVIDQGQDATIGDEELGIMLENIGILDEQIRDRGIFFTFSGLMSREVFAKEQIWDCLAYLSQDEILFNHILEPENDAVFGRSLAVLLISILLVADRIYGGVLTKTQYWQVIQQVATYALLEHDPRGYVPEKGWAHAFTHLGNVLAETANSRLTRAQKLFLLTACLVGYQEAAAPFAFGEDQRFAMATVALVEKENFYLDYLLGLLHAWVKRLPENPDSGDYRFWSQWYNRSHYFSGLLQVADAPEKLVKYVRSLQ